MCRLEPSGELSAWAVGSEVTKAHKSLHLMGAAVHVFFQGAQMRERRIATVLHQTATVFEAPQERIKPIKTVFIAVPYHAVGHVDEPLGHAHCSLRLGQRRCVKKAYLRRAIIGPFDLLGRDVIAQQAPCCVAPSGRSADAGQGDPNGHNRLNCSGGGANRARNCALSASAPGLQSRSVINGCAFFKSAPMRCKSL